MWDASLLTSVVRKAWVLSLYSSSTLQSCFESVHTVNVTKLLCSRWHLMYLIFESTFCALHCGTISTKEMEELITTAKLIKQIADRGETAPGRSLQKHGFVE